MGNWGLAAASGSCVAARHPTSRGFPRAPRRWAKRDSLSASLLPLLGTEWSGREARQLRVPC
eukprot:2458982-Heterocapsa_arctica.AAC.2